MPVFPEAAKERLKSFASEHKFRDIRRLVDAMLALKVLVVGDVIIDEYAYCDILGLMSKSAMGWSARYKSRETFIGGSLAVARHASRFAGDVTVCGIAGSEADIHSAILNNLGSETRIDLVYSESVPTIVKTKYVATNEPRDEYSKLLSLNAVPEWNAETDVETRSVFLCKLRENLPKFDAVIVCDFGHGLIDEGAMDLLQKRSKFLAVNCQTNSVNMGMNLITKYSRADVFSLDQRELKFAVARQDLDERESLEKLRRRFGDCKGFLTRGSSGAYAVDKTGSIYDFPAFTASVKDTVGAGDAFFVMAALCGATGVSCETGLFLSNAMGALAARIVGNKNAVEKANLLKFICSLTAF
jgi:bifunctional ADP-heptose synthase (sugar kinase/adenylyltransferase)